MSRSDGRWTPVTQAALGLLVGAIGVLGFTMLAAKCFSPIPAEATPTPIPSPTLAAPTWTMPPMATSTPIRSPTISTGARTATALSFATPVPFPTEAPVVDTPEPAATIGTLPKTGERR